MKTLIISALCLCCFAVGASAQQKTMKTRVDSVGYSLGWDVGTSIKTQDIEVTPTFVAQGILDALEGRTGMLTDEQTKEVLMSLQQELIAKQQAMMAKQAEAGAKEGATFLAENKKRKGVVTLPSGLQYEVIKEGKGPKPTATSNVSVHYTGSLTNGQVFDSSIERGEPTSFEVGGVIRGWTEALQLMSVGSKWKLFIPADLAYGTQGVQGTIPPNAVLIFDVELLAIN